MSRYTVGERLTVISFITRNISNPEDPETGTTFFLPWEATPTHTFMVHLTVTEVHSVPSCFDPKAGPRKYEGYTAKDGLGHIWHNQYPTASYGQTSTEADYLWSPATQETCEFYFGPKWETRSSWSGMKDLGAYLSNAKRGIHNLNKQNCTEYAKMLADHTASVEENFTSVTGMHIAYVPTYFQRSDPRLVGGVCPGWFTTVIFDPSPAARKEQATNFVEKWASRILDVKRSSPSPSTGYDGKDFSVYRFWWDLSYEFTRAMPEETSVQDANLLLESAVDLMTLCPPLPGESNSSITECWRIFKDAADHSGRFFRRPDEAAILEELWTAREKQEARGDSQE